MTSGADRLLYDGMPIRRYLDQTLPRTDTGDDECFFYIMGPYTAFDIAYAQAGGDVDDDHEPDYVDDPLFDPDRHTGTSRSNYEAALAEVCERIRSEVGVRAFLATDANIPTPNQAEIGDTGLTPLTQSLYLAAASDAVAFVFSAAALNAGVGAEMGAILSTFNLRPRSEQEPMKERMRFRIFSTDGFGSATVDGAPLDFAIDQSKFESVNELIDQIESFIIPVAYGYAGKRWNGPNCF